MYWEIRNLGRMCRVHANLSHPDLVSSRFGFFLVFDRNDRISSSNRVNIFCEGRDRHAWIKIILMHTHKSLWLKETRPSDISCSPVAPLPSLQFVLVTKWVFKYVSQSVTTLDRLSQSCWHQTVPSQIHTWWPSTVPEHDYRWALMWTHRLSRTQPRINRAWVQGRYILGTQFLNTAPFCAGAQALVLGHQVWTWPQIAVASWLLHAHNLARNKPTYPFGSAHLTLQSCSLYFPVQKRNKPKEPPKAPKAAPFFLPTEPGLVPKFVPAAEDLPEVRLCNLANRCLPKGLGLTGVTRVVVVLVLVIMLLLRNPAEHVHWLGTDRLLRPRGGGFLKYLEIEICTPCKNMWTKK